MVMDMLLLVHAKTMPEFQSHVLLDARSAKPKQRLILGAIMV
jgi:hypothetical protein